MNIAAVNGSPRGESSASMEALAIVRSFLPSGTEWSVVSSIREPESRDCDTDESIGGGDARAAAPHLNAILEADVLLIAFPLYVDGLPASLMRFLRHLETAFRVRRDSGAEPGSSGPDGRTGESRKVPRVFAIANCGFHEGVQNESALEMIGHFCAESGLRWCGGVGIGTGGMIQGLRTVPKEAGIRKPVTDALGTLAGAIREPDGALPHPVFTRHGISWLVYKLAAELGWRAQLRKNGRRYRELGARPLLPR